MSRGPGRWQRLLLDLLAEYETVPVREAVHHAVAAPVRADFVHARRAARTLALAGTVTAAYLWQCTACHRTLTAHPYRCCGRLTHVLVVTRDPQVRCVQTGRLPPWVSGATIRKRNTCHPLPEAPHTQEESP